MDAGAEGVDDQLGDADQDGAHALVADAQDLLPVADNYQVDVLGVAPLLDVVFDAAGVVDVEEAALGLAEEARIVGDGVALGRGVDDGEHFLEVVEDEAVVQHLVLLLEAGHEGVLGQVARAGAVLGIGALDLLVERLDVGGEQAMELERVALVLGEGRAFVEVGRPEQRIALAAGSAGCFLRGW